MTYSYRVYGLNLRSDTAISSLPVEHTDFEPPDIAMSLGPEPEWARDAMRLSHRMNTPRAGEAEGDDSPFTLTSFGEGEFCQLAYDDGTRFIVDGAGKASLGNLAASAHHRGCCDLSSRACPGVCFATPRHLGASRQFCVYFRQRRDPLWFLRIRQVHYGCGIGSPWRPRTHRGYLTGQRRPRIAVCRTRLSANLFVARYGRESFWLAGGLAADHANLGKMFSGSRWRESYIRIEQAASQNCLSFRATRG